MILSGLRVIDCGTYIAAPAAATILSDFGAEVIKIERPPHGDPYRYLRLGSRHAHVRSRIIAGSSTTAIRKASR